MKEITISPRYSAFFGLAAALVTLTGVPAAIYIFDEKITDQDRRIDALQVEQYRHANSIVRVQSDYAQCRVDFSVMSTAVDKYAARIDGVNNNIMRYLERTNAK